MKYNITIDFTKEEFNKLQDCMLKANEKGFNFYTFSQFIDVAFNVRKKIILNSIFDLWEV